MVHSRSRSRELADGEPKRAADRDRSVRSHPGAAEVFPTWRRAQHEVDRLAGEALLTPRVLRTTGFLRPELAERVASGGLGVRVNHVRNDGDAYNDAAELCAELRERGSMTLTTIATEAPHPLLADQEGGVVDQLRVVHDVFGHAALGVGFDLQSEFATWLQCRTRADRRRPISSRRA